MYKNFIRSPYSIKTIGLGLLLFLIFFSGTAFAAKPEAVTKPLANPTTLSSAADFLSAATTKGVSGSFALKSGKYLVPSTVNQIDLASVGITNLEIGQDVTLRVGEEGTHSKAIVLVKELEITGGSLIACGGNAEKATAFDLTSLKISGAPSLIISGGSGRYASGIIVSENMTITGEPTGTVLGGSGEEATAIFVQGQVSINSKGDLTFQGGSGNYSAGLLATKELSYAGKGRISFTGGDGTASFGLATFRLVVMTGAGSINARGGLGDNSAGIMFANTAEIHGTIFMYNGSVAPAVAQIGKHGYAQFYPESSLIVSVEFGAEAGKEVGKMVVLSEKEVLGRSEVNSGKIPARSGVYIDEGAKLLFWSDAQGDEDLPLQSGGVFMSTPNADISGFFKLGLLDAISSFKRMSANIDLVNANQYSISAERIREVPINSTK